MPLHLKPHTQTIRWFESPSCYVFHTLNAYEVGDDIVLIACRMFLSLIWQTGVKR